MQLSEQEILRRKSREELMAMGVDPYPAGTFEVNVTAAHLKRNFDSHPNDYTNLSVAGRLMARRIMGSASFAEIQDSSGRIQIYIRRDDICKGTDKTCYNDIFKKKMDIGDIVGIKGYAFKTEVGETSIHVTELKLLTKSLKPLPVVKEVTDKEGNKKVYDAFKDPEQRYRQRYLDLIVNPEIRQTFTQRTKLINSIREFLAGRGYLEVETPVLQPLYGGAAARPFKTHHNTLDMALYLRIANELYLKRLIVGGYNGVFEFAKDFRNEGMSRFHNPEFTQLELYVAYKDYNWMMDTMEEMIEKAAISLHEDTKVQVGEHVIDFKRPWKRFTMFEAIRHFTDIDISEMDEEALREAAKKLEVTLDETMAKGKIIDEIFGEKCEPMLIQPTFITDYPVEMSPLTKKHRAKEGLVERFEAICNGKEIMNAYSELNDPIDQRERFEEQMELGRRGDHEAMTMDEDFLQALAFGMPPTAGVGIGMDRLAMIMTNSNAIQDVLFFPQMRPKTTSQTAELSGDENEVFRKLQKAGKMPLSDLKEQSGLSNKKWDKAIKTLTQGGFAKVNKINEDLFVEVGGR